MEYRELKETIEGMPEQQLKDYRVLLSYSSIAGNVWSQFEKHLAQAETPDEFFEAVYNDDACRMENVWARWAVMNSKKWPDRFEPDFKMANVPLDNKGVFLQSGENEYLVPLKGRGQTIDIYVFPEDGFNEKAAEFYGSINGSFTCRGITLEGTFDIFRAPRAIIFERWNVDVFKRRAGGKGQIRTDCDCSTKW